MTNATHHKHDVDQAKRLQDLYEQYFVPPVNDTVFGYFKQVSIYDYSVKSYTTNSTASKESCA